MTTIKTTFKRIICILSCCLVVVFSFTFTSSAVIDENLTFYFSCPNPATTFDGYIILPQTDKTATLVGWYITPQSIYDSDNITNYDIEINAHVEQHQVSIDFMSTNANENYLVSVYYIEDGSSHVERLNTQFVSFGSPYSMYVRNQNYSFVAPNYFKNVTRLSHSNYDEYDPNLGFTYDCVFSDNAAEFNQLKDVNTHFLLTLSKLDLTNEQLVALVDYMNQILEVTSAMGADLSDFIYVYWSQFQQEEFPNALGQVITNLQKIVQALDPKDAEEITTYAPDTFEDLNKVDESLHDMIDSDEYESLLDGGLDGYVDLNTPAYRLIWDFIEAAFNSHPEILLLVFTILSLGVIALIFNR